MKYFNNIQLHLYQALNVFNQVPSALRLIYFPKKCKQYFFKYATILYTMQELFKNSFFQSTFTNNKPLQGMAPPSQNKCSLHSSSLLSPLLSSLLDTRYLFLDLSLDKSTLRTLSLLLSLPSSPLSRSLSISRTL